MHMSGARALELKTLVLEQQGRVLTARFFSPPLNFANSAFIRDLDVLTDAVDKDDSIGAVVLTGGVADRFLTHADPSEFGEITGVPLPPLTMDTLRPLLWLTRLVLQVPAILRMTESIGHPLARASAFGFRWRRATLRMNRSSTVYIAAINGPTTGGGHEIALACDLRFVSDAPEIRLGQIEALAGLTPGGGGTQRLPRIIGTAKALEHMLEGTPITTAQALELGLVTAVVPAADLVTVAQDAAARLARRSPVSVRVIKRLTYFATSRPLGSGLDAEVAGFVATGLQPAMKATIQAFNADLAHLDDSPWSTGDKRWVQGTRVDYTA
jgi:enoyl-CoA hydratase